MTSRLNQNPLPDTVSGDLFSAGLAMTVMPGFLEEAASVPADEAQSLAQTVVDKLLSFSFGSLAASAAPAFMTASGVALIGERFLSTLDVLFDMAKKVEESGKSIAVQAEIIQSFGPLLEISDETLQQLIVVAKEKGVQWEERKLTLKKLEQNYPANADLLAIVRKRIDFLQAVVPEIISKNRITVFGQRALESRVTLVQQIAAEENEAKALMSELTELTQSVDEMVTKLEHFEVQTSASAETKGTLIAGLQGDAEALVRQQDLVAKTMSRASHGNVSLITC